MAGKIVVRILAGIGGLVVVGVLVGAFSRDATPARAAGPAVAPVASAPAELTTEAIAGLGPGRWEIGTDVQPGKYRTAGPESDAFPLCTWSVEKPDGGIVDIKNSNGPATYTIPKKAGYLFDTSGCAPWVTS